MSGRDNVAKISTTTLSEGDAPEPIAWTPASPAPLGPAEELCWRAEQDHAGAFRVMVVLRLDGCVEEEPLCAALQQLQRRHPKLRATVAHADDGRQWFHFDGCAPPIPFRITDYEGASPWRNEARGLFAVVFSGSGPLAALTVLRNRSRGCSELLLTVHHAIADGRSGIMLVDDLLTAYAAAEAGRDHVGPALPVITAVCATGSASWRNRWWLLRRFLRIQREERRRRLTPLPEAREIAPQSQWVHWIFSSSETLALVRRCRREQTSLNGVLVAAICCGLMDCLPAAHGIFKCQIPFDLRQAVAGPRGPVTPDDLGSFVSIMNEFYQVHQPPAFWDVARRARADLDEFVQRGGPSFYYNVAAAVIKRDVFALGTQRLSASGSARPTLLATNYGVLNMRDAYGSLRPTACTLTFKNDNTGPSLIAESLVMGQRLNVGFAAAALEPGLWQKLQIAVRGRLDGACST